MKRFTETVKWEDPWFRALSPRLKCVWGYFCDRCDNAGVITPDWPLISFVVGEPVTEADLKSFGRQIEVIGEKLYLRGFIAFQYGNLSPDCKPHAAVLALLSRHNITPKGYPKGIHTLQEKEKDKEEETDKEKETEKDDGKCPLQLRAEKLLKKRASTPWSRSELTAWAGAKAIVADTTPEEWADLEAWFALSSAPYRRNGFAALLNNWADEIQRCRRPENLALIAAAPDAASAELGRQQRQAF